MMWSGAEALTISDAALDKLAEQGEKSSLRYALQLMTPAGIVAKVSGQEGIEAGNVEECNMLFLDAKRSARIVREMEERFVTA
jgi:RuvB-like protein 1